MRFACGRLCVVICGGGVRSCRDLLKDFDVRDWETVNRIDGLAGFYPEHNSRCAKGLRFLDNDMGIIADASFTTVSGAIVRVPCVANRPAESTFSFFEDVEC